MAYNYDTQTKTLTICLLVLLVKYYLTQNYQISTRVRAGTKPPEDQPATSHIASDITQDFGQNIQGNASDRESEMRWSRIMANDAENIPLGLVFMVFAVLIRGNETANMVGIIAFTASRVLHTLFFASKIQPWRTIIWNVGQLALLLLAVNSIICVFT